jgi:hypothetical protein
VWGGREGDGYPCSGKPATYFWTGVGRFASMMATRSKAVLIQPLIYGLGQLLVEGMARCGRAITWPSGSTSRWPHRCSSPSTSLVREWQNFSRYSGPMGSQGVPIADATANRSRGCSG